MTENKIFNLNQLSRAMVQIYGKVNGFARKRPNGVFGNGEFDGTYVYAVKFFNKNNHLITLISSEKDGTIRSLEKLEARILREYNEENN